MDAKATYALLEEILGGLLIFFVLLDVFLTILYARVASGLLSRRIAHYTWTLFLWISKPFPHHRGRVLSFCGPVIVVLFVVAWGGGLIFGTALIIHPHLGGSVQMTDGPTPTDFFSALFAGGSSVGILGSSDFAPKSRAFRALFLFNSLAGMSALSLTLTYVLQVYRALHERNCYGLKTDLGAGQNADGAELVVGIGPRGRFEIGYGSLAEAAAELIRVKESHHLYPVLFYFRFAEPLYSVSRFLLTTFDAVSLLKSALDDETYSWLKESGAVQQLWKTSFLMVTTLGDAFVPKAMPKEVEAPSEEERARWRRRFAVALSRVQEAGIKTVANVEAGAERYVTLRAEWDRYICNLAPFMGYEAREIDPVGHAENPGDGSQSKIKK